MRTIAPQLKDIILYTDRRIYFVVLCIILGLINYIFSLLISMDELYTSLYDGKVALSRLQEIKTYNQNNPWLTYALIPVVLALKFSLITLCLMIGFLLYDLEISFKKIFSAVLLAELVFVIPPIIKLLWFSFIHTDFTFNDIIWFYPLALSNFFNLFETARWLQYPLQVFNLFEVFYWFWLAYCLSVILKLSFKKMVKVILTSYLPFLLLWILLIVFIAINLSI